MIQFLLATLALAGRGPLLQSALIILGTFVLEDAATVLAAMQAQSGSVPVLLALASLYIGIVLGDLGLYGLGYLSSRVSWIERLLPARRRRQGTEWLQGRLFQVVFVSRFIPGARLPTYLACGFLNAGVLRFAVAAVLATLVWTSLLFGISLRVGALLLEHLGAWRWAGALGFAAAVVLIGRGAARLQEARR